MKVRSYLITFTKEVEVTVYAPEDATTAEVRMAAEGAAETLDQNWDVPEWDVTIGAFRERVLPDEHRQPRVSRYGTIQAPRLGPLGQDDVVVLSDDRVDLVNAADARWWVLAEDPAATPDTPQEDAEDE